MQLALRPYVTTGIVGLVAPSGPRLNVLKANPLADNTRDRPEPGGPAFALEEADTTSAAEHRWDAPS